MTIEPQFTDFVASEFFKIVAAARNHSLGPFSPAFDIQKVLTNRLHKYLPENAHKIVSRRLHISLTRIFDGKNVVVSQFNSREDLIDALACSFFIPGFSGILPPKFHGVRYMDGAFSDNLVALDDHTVTVSPFCGETDICPRDDTQFKFHVSIFESSNLNSALKLIYYRSAYPTPAWSSQPAMHHVSYMPSFHHPQKNSQISANKATTMP